MTRERALRTVHGLLGLLIVAGLIWLAWLWEKRENAPASQPPNPSGVRLGDSPEAVRAALGEPEEDDVDQSLKYDGVGPEEAGREVWRQIFYLQMHETGPGPVKAFSVNLRFQYRSDTGKVWSIRVMDDRRLANLAIEKLPSAGNLDDAKEALGKPSRQAPGQGSIFDRYYWNLGDLGYYVDVYNREEMDLGVKHEQGDIHTAFVCSLSAAPEGFRSQFDTAGK